MALVLTATMGRKPEQKGFHSVSNQSVVQETDEPVGLLPGYLRRVIDSFDERLLTIQLDISENDEGLTTINQLTSNMRFFRLQTSDLDDSTWKLDFRSVFQLRVPDAFLDRKLILRVFFSNTPVSPSSEYPSDLETSLDLNSFDDDELTNSSEKYSDPIERTCDHDIVCVQELCVVRPLATSSEVVMLHENCHGVVVSIKNVHKEALITLKDMQLCSKMLSTHLNSTLPSTQQSSAQQICPPILNILPETLYPRETFTTCFVLEKNESNEKFSALSISWSTMINSRCIDIRECISCSANHLPDLFPFKREKQLPPVKMESLLSHFLHDISSTRQQLLVQKNSDIQLKVALIDHARTELKVGMQVSICIQVSNVSMQTSYDLYVLHETLMQSDQNPCANTGWLSFEASQRLG